MPTDPNKKHLRKLLQGGLRLITHLYHLHDAEKERAVRLMDMHKLAKAIEPDGGGHPDAAGFVSSMSPEAVVFHIENVLQQSHLPDSELNQWMNRLATSRRTQEACDCAEKAL